MNDKHVSGMCWLLSSVLTSDPFRRSAYMGSEPHIFVSYSHHNASVVLPELSWPNCYFEVRSSPLSSSVTLSNRNNTMPSGTGS